MRREIERLRQPKSCEDVSFFLAEKLKRSGSKLLGTFYLRHVTAVVDDSKPGTRDLFMKPFTKAERNEFVFAAPQNKCRLLYHRQPVVENILAMSQAIENLADRIAIPGSYSLSKRKIDIRILIESLVVKRQRPKVPNVVPTRQLQCAQCAPIHRLRQCPVTGCVTQDEAFHSFWMCQGKGRGDPTSERITNERCTLDFQFVQKAIQKIDEGADTIT